MLSAELNYGNIISSLKRHKFADAEKLAVQELSRTPAGFDLTMLTAQICMNFKNVSLGARSELLWAGP